MTDQTVPVPVYLLKEVADGATLVSDYLEGTHGTISGSATLALKSIVALIPSPPKVGDVLTAEQIKELPVNAVLRDADDDVWLTADGGVVLAVVSGGHLSSDAATPIDEYMHYSPFVLVSLPTPRD